MVSFSCENCGDVLTKKKLDPHRNQCRGAVFTCLDCQTTFKGTDYRSHTSCITEDQKYQGALYREKPTKAAKRKSVSILEPTDQNALVRHQPYVEDAPDVDAPPHVPTPPSAVPTKNNRDSVFDYMVDDDQQNTPQIAFTKKSQGEMAMKNGAPSVFPDSRSSSRNGYRNAEERQYSQQYDDLGYSYGTEPVNPRPYNNNYRSMDSLNFMTPSARSTREMLDQAKNTNGHHRTNSGSEKKRKREIGNTAENDTLMIDAPSQGLRTEVNTPLITHSGLTGGLNKMLTEDNEAFPNPERGERRNGADVERDRSSRRNEKRDDPTSPLKRSRHSKDDSGLGISIKGRAVKALSAVGGAFVGGQQGDMVKTRRRASSSEHSQRPVGDRENERRERKKHKVHRHNGTSSSNIRHEPRTRRRGSNESPESQRRKMKTIEYHKHDDSGSDSDNGQRSGPAQMVVFGAEAKMKKRCETFLFNIPGDEVENGYSVHKALKRWHKQLDNSRSGKQEEEQELWRGLRLRKNDQGEIVLFF